MASLLIGIVAAVALLPKCFVCYVVTGGYSTKNSIGRSSILKRKDLLHSTLLGNTFSVL